jgi:hypothetical protein
MEKGRKPEKAFQVPRPEGEGFRVRAEKCITRSSKGVLMQFKN